MDYAQAFGYIGDVRQRALATIDQINAMSRNSIEVLWKEVEAGLNVSPTINLTWEPPDIDPVPEFTSEITYEELSNETYKTYIWSTSGDTKLKTQIWNIFTNGGIGLSQSLQSSIFNSDLERKQQILNDGLVLANARIASKGFRRPTSMVTAQENELIIKYNFDRENQSREITKLMEEHARTNIQFAIQQGIAIEQLQADFTSKFNNIAMEIVKTSLEKYRTEVTAELTAYEFKVKSILAEAEVLKTKATYYASISSTVIDKYKADIQQETAKTNMLVSNASVNTTFLTQAMHAQGQNIAQLLASVSSTDVSLTTKKSSQ